MFFVKGTKLNYPEHLFFTGKRIILSFLRIKTQTGVIKKQYNILAPKKLSIPIV